MRTESPPKTLKEVKEEVLKAQARVKDLEDKASTWLRRKDDFKHTFVTDLMKVYDQFLVLAPDGAKETTSTQLKNAGKDLVRAAILAAKGALAGKTVNWLFGKKELEEKAMGVGSILTAAFAGWKIKDEHQAQEKARGFLALVEDIKSDRKKIEKRFEEISEILYKRFEIALEKIPTKHQVSPIARFFSTVIVRDIPDTKDAILEGKLTSAEIAQRASEIAIPRSPKDPMYVNLLTNKAIKTDIKADKKWTISGLFLHSAIYSISDSNYYRIDGEKSKVSKYSVQRVYTVPRGYKVILSHEKCFKKIKKNELDLTIQQRLSKAQEELRQAQERCDHYKENQKSTKIFAKKISPNLKNVKSPDDIEMKHFAENRGEYELKNAVSIHDGEGIEQSLHLPLNDANPSVLQVTVQQEIKSQSGIVENKISRNTSLDLADILYKLGKIILVVPWSIPFIFLVPGLLCPPKPEQQCEPDKYYWIFFRLPHVCKDIPISWARTIDRSLEILPIFFIGILALTIPGLFWPSDKFPKKKEDNTFIFCTKTVLRSTECWLYLIKEILTECVRRACNNNSTHEVEIVKKTESFLCFNKETTFKRVIDRSSKTVVSEKPIDEQYSLGF